MKICFFAPGYPGEYDEGYYAFVKQLVDAIAEKGNECYVIAPYNIRRFRKLVGLKEDYKVSKGTVRVLRPYFLSVSRVRSLQWLSRMSRKQALRKAIKIVPQDIDAIYGHFWNSGYEGYQYAKQRNLPLFVATGESDIKSMFVLPGDLQDFNKFVRGVICVSSKNRDESIGLGLTTREKCGVFPNAVNEQLFYKQDKLECRNKLGLQANVFIVCFVGWFNERKGVLRVSEAIKQVGGVKSIFIGKGEQVPQCEGILFKGAVPHDEVPLYLGASDCFVLPTLAEGCCNAVVEAMSCGLPVVSSNLPFNWDVLDDSNSIMIDPNNIDEIANAIRTLKDDYEKRQSLAEGAVKKAEQLKIGKRAEAILQFIKDHI